LSNSSSVVAHQFDDHVQQRDANYLGMWIFLVTEIMFFGGLFAGYTLYRSMYPEAFAEGSRHLSMALGGINTALLALSTLMVTLAVESAREEKPRAVCKFLSYAMILGVIFLSIKFLEYYQKWQENLVPGAQFQYQGTQPHELQLFYSFYFVMTSIHALHLLIGIFIIGGLVIWMGRRPDKARPNAFIEMTGLYWHFVDIIWIFIFPLLYLARQ
jgi:cytochrome c oxidase subunit III